MRIPFFHYLYLDSLSGVLNDHRLISRQSLNKLSKKFSDISIDPAQPVREEKGLLNYIPLFPGYYARGRSFVLNGYLMKNYDDPKVQNKSFYGTLNRTLQTRLGSKYENVIILLINDELVYRFADNRKVRYFTDIAVKPNCNEVEIINRASLVDCLKEHMDDRNIFGEVDLLDDGKESISVPSNI